MRKRPWTFFLTSLTFAGIAVAFPVQIAVLYGHGFQELPLIFQKLTGFNWVCIACLLMLSYMAWNGTRWLYVGIPFTMAVVVWNNFLVGYWGYDYSLTTTFYSSLLFSGLCLFPFLPHYAAVIQNPKLRWWLVAARKEIMIPVYITQGRGQQFQTKTRDISKTGAFIESQLESPRLGEVLDLNLKINTLQQLQLKAEVVRFQEDEDGFGVRFQDMTSPEKRLLDKYLQNH